MASYRLNFVNPYSNGIARHLLRSGRRAAMNPVSGNLVVRHGVRAFEIEAVPAKSKVTMVVIDSGNDNCQVWQGEEYKRSFSGSGAYAITNPDDVAFTVDAIFITKTLTLMKFDHEGNGLAVRTITEGPEDLAVGSDAGDIFAQSANVGMYNEFASYSADLATEYWTATHNSGALTRMWRMMLDADYLYIVERTTGTTPTVNRVSRYTRTGGGFVTTLNLDGDDKIVDAAIDGNYLYVFQPQLISLYNIADISPAGISFVPFSDVTAGAVYNNEIYAAEASFIEIYDLAGNWLRDINGDFSNITGIDIKLV